MGANVFKYGINPWRYPRNWFNNIDMFFRQLRWAYQRATKGFCDMDVWDLDGAILNYLSGTIEQLADVCHGYPGDDRFPTPESWDKFLRGMANDFYRANEWNDYYDHPAYDAWAKALDDGPISDENGRVIDRNPELSAAMVQEDRDLAEIRDKDLEVGLMKLRDVLWNLWD